RRHFSERVGTPVSAVLFSDDMETDRGWQVEHEATSGRWQRAEPRGTWLGAIPVQPDEDASPTGRLAFVTGNAGTMPRDDDVDAGTTRLVSPLLDASSFVSLELRYARWLYREGPATAPEDASGLIVEVSDDGGESWVLVEVAAEDVGGWIEVHRDLDPLVVPAERLRLRVSAVDLTRDYDRIVEAALDEVVIEGFELVCD
ncbi:MAG: hypothetical protein JSV80_08635, partial [Acidobacteriota bacterium]